MLGGGKAEGPNDPNVNRHPSGTLHLTSLDYRYAHTRPAPPTSWPGQPQEDETIEHRPFTAATGQQYDRTYSIIPVPVQH